MKIVDQFRSEFATKLYTHTSNHTNVTLEGEDKNMATRAFGLAQPNYLPDGINLTTNGAFGGLLNLIGKYDDMGQPPENTRQWIA